MSGIFDSELDSILEGTSRSFYLSLKELPNSIRPQVSLLYMLARTSDTIADSEQGDSSELLESHEVTTMAKSYCHLYQIELWKFEELKQYFVASLKPNLEDRLSGPFLEYQQQHHPLQILRLHP